MGRNRDVPHLTVGRSGIVNHELDAGVHQLGTHQHREDDRYQSEKSGGPEVEDTDILVVRRAEPAGKEPRIVVITMRVIVSNADFSHKNSSLRYLQRDKICH